MAETTPSTGPETNIPKPEAPAQDTEALKAIVETKDVAEQKRLMRLQLEQERATGLEGIQKRAALLRTVIRDSMPEQQKEQLLATLDTAQSETLVDMQSKGQIDWTDRYAQEWLPSDWSATAKRRTVYGTAVAAAIAAPFVIWKAIKMAGGMVKDAAVGTVTKVRDMILTGAAIAAGALGIDHFVFNGAIRKGISNIASAASWFTGGGENADGKAPEKTIWNGYGWAPWASSEKPADTPAKKTEIAPIPEGELKTVMTQLETAFGLDTVKPLKDFLESREWKLDGSSLKEFLRIAKDQCGIDLAWSGDSSTLTMVRGDKKVDIGGAIGAGSVSVLRDDEGWDWPGMLYWYALGSGVYGTSLAALKLVTLNTYGGDTGVRGVVGEALLWPAATVRRLYNAQYDLPQFLTRLRSITTLPMGRIYDSWRGTSEENLRLRAELALASREARIAAESSWTGVDLEACKAAEESALQQLTLYVQNVPPDQLPEWFKKALEEEYAHVSPKQIDVELMKELLPRINVNAVEIDKAQKELAAAAQELTTLEQKLAALEKEKNTEAAQKLHAEVDTEVNAVIARVSAIADLPEVKTQRDALQKRVQAAEAKIDRWAQLQPPPATVEAQPVVQAELATPATEPTIQAELADPKEVRDALGKPVIFGVEGNRWTNKDAAETYKKKGGWKLHLSVKPENYAAVDRWLFENHKGQYKLLSGGAPEEGKDFTVYIGSKVEADALATKMTSEIDGLLEASKAGTEDLKLTPKIAGRFDVQSTGKGFSELGLKYYGIDGVPFDKKAMDRTSVAFGAQLRSPQDAALKEKYFQQQRIEAQRIEGILASEYGEYYTGKPTDAASEATTQRTETKSAAEVEPAPTPVVEPATAPVEKETRAPTSVPRPVQRKLDQWKSMITDAEVALQKAAAGNMTELAAASRNLKTLQTWLSDLRTENAGNAAAETRINGVLKKVETTMAALDKVRGKSAGAGRIAQEANSADIADIVETRQTLKINPGTRAAESDVDTDADTNADIGVRARR
jgi:hypothetical protein